MFTDIKECEEDPTICDTGSSMCVNLPGSYHCSCLPGYIKQDDVCKGKGISQSTKETIFLLHTECICELELGIDLLPTIGIALYCQWEAVLLRQWGFP